jgi:DNA-directed RNA polymerase subunit RPC12/RpoP
MISNNQVSAKCKRCGKTAPSTSFVLDPDYKLMVCPQCIKEKKEAERVRRELEKKKTEKQELAAKETPEKPKGWDSEDEYLERHSKKIETVNVAAERIDNTKIRCTCPSCKYAFVYDTAKKHPKACPYCNAQVLPFTPK